MKIHADAERKSMADGVPILSAEIKDQGWNIFENGWLGMNE
jgi:hypothetical protein